MFNPYSIVNKRTLTEAQFERLILAIIEGFSDLFEGPDSTPISWEYVQGVDHSIACLTAQRYKVPVETGAATSIMDLHNFMETEARRKLVKEFIKAAKQDKLS